MKIRVIDNHPRLDKYLIKIIDDVPMSLIQKLIRKKNILVNNTKTKPSQKLLNDDEISILYNFKKIKKHPKKFTSIENKEKFLKLIIYENESFIIINKLPNISVQGGSKITTSLKEIYESLLDIKLYLVHRLDKDTSGLIILVKTRFIAADFSKLFLEKKIHKYYLVLTDSSFSKKSFFLINKNNENKTMKLRYRFLHNVDDFFVYYVSLLTGRKHQIRLQFALNDNPIKNDNKFYPVKNKKNLCLCSFSLNFFHKDKFYNFRLPFKETLKLMHS